ncbi:MAG: hypothetical protein MJ252_26715 [archaeon]|nr:hypothetical protein [archaeon]
MDASYFLKEERKGTTEEFTQPIIQAFNSLYVNDGLLKEYLSSKEVNIYKSVEEHPFLGKFLKDSHDVNVRLENENELADSVFMDYLNKMSLHSNPTYFSKLIVFVTLYREYANIAKKTQNKNGEEYTAVNSAEDIPDLSNEFINDFLEPERGIFEFTKEEAIDLTQNICHWMYENNFTCSKLSLINSCNNPNAPGAEATQGGQPNEVSQNINS